MPSETRNTGFFSGFIKQHCPRNFPSGAKYLGICFPCFPSQHYYMFDDFFGKRSLWTFAWRVQDGPFQRSLYMELPSKKKKLIRYYMFMIFYGHHSPTLPRLGWFPQFVPKYCYFFVEPLEVLGSVTQHLSSMDDIGQHFFCGAGPRGVACGDRGVCVWCNVCPPNVPMPVT